MTGFGDGKAPWRRVLALTGVLGVLAPCARLAADVAISELLYHPQNALLEFVELHNTGTTPVDLGGWSFTDGIVYSFPPGSEIAAGGWIVVCAYRNEVAAEYEIPVQELFGDYEGALANGGERVALSDAQGIVVDAVEFSDAPPFDPAADGFGPSLERLCFEASAATPGNWRASSTPGGTPLEPNSQAACPPPLPPAFSGVVFHEIYYHPPGNADPDEEFVELHNTSDTLADLEGIVIAGGIDYVFDRAAGPVQIPPGGFLLVAKNPERLSQVTGISAASMAGPYTGQLSNFREEIRLEIPGGATLDRVEYSEDGLWPAHADGLGSSLQLIHPRVSSALPQNWTVAADDRCAQGQNCVFVTNGASVRWYENLDGGDPGFVGGTPWFDPDFNDVANAWRSGRLAVGYDSRVPTGQPWILTPSSSQDGLHSILLRVEFFHDPETSPCESQAPFLSIDWDDGYVAWLNGVEVSRGGMLDPPGTVPAFDGEYRAEIVTAGGYRQTEPQYRVVWSGVAGDIRPGRNVLAIGNYNSRSTSSDLYLSARLTLGADILGREVTPGQPNAVASSVVPPLVRDVEFFPSEPRSTDTVTVRARVEGPEVERVDLIVDAGSGEFTLEMRDDGLLGDSTAADGVYSARIAPAAHLSLVRFRIEAWAHDAQSCPGSFPREGNPSPYTGYFVADDRPEVNEDVRLFYIFTPGALTDLSCADGAYRSGDFVDFRGRAYFDVGVKFRGETACNYPKKPIRVEFNRGDTFDGQSDLNFNAGWNDKAMLREKLGFDLFRDAGIAYSETHLARVHTNGGAFHGAYFTIEDPSGEYLRRNDWDSGGALYKCRTAMLDSSTGGYEARTDTAVERIADVGAFASSLNGLNGQALVDLLNSDLDVEAMIDYQAVQVVLIDGDSVVKNWLLYLGPHGRGQTGPERFACFAWDIDLSCGQMYLVQDVRHHDIHPLFQTQTYPFVGQGHHGIVNALLQRAPDDYYVKAYYGRMWTLLEEKFHPDVFLDKIDRYDQTTIETVRDDLARWPRTWGSRGTDPDYWRDDLRAWARRRYDYLTGYLLGDNPTTSGRRFQYTPAPRLKLTEIHYNPEEGEDLEFLELYNLETTAVALDGWTIPAIEYEFPAGSEAPAASYWLVARNPQRLLAAGSVPEGVPVFGPYVGNLSNGGEEIRLRDTGEYRGKTYFPETIDVVNYDDDAPWPEAADGDGYSLELRSVGLDNDYAASWQASRVRGGTPGSGFLSNLPPVVHVTATPTRGIVPLRVSFDASASFDPEGDEFTVRWDFGDGFIGVGPQVTRTFRTPGVYRVTLTLEASRGPSATEVIEIRALSEGDDVLFVRGDVNADGRIDISDPVRLLLALFQGAPLDCRQAADSDDSGALDITDGVVLLRFLFQQGPPPAAPYPGCGVAAPDGGLDCASYGPCAR